MSILRATCRADKCYLHKYLRMQLHECFKQLVKEVHHSPAIHTEVFVISSLPLKFPFLRSIAFYEPIFTICVSQDNIASEVTSAGPALRSKPISYQWDPGHTYPIINRPKLETDRSPAFRVWDFTLMAWWFRTYTFCV